MDGQIIAAIICGSVTFTGAICSLLWRLGSRVGKLEGKLNGINPAAFGRVEEKVDTIDKRMHSYELQLNDFGKGISRLDRRIDDFLGNSSRKGESK